MWNCMSIGGLGRRGGRVALAMAGLLGLILVGPAQADVIRAQLDFDPPTVGDSRVNVAGCVPLGAPGSPLLPAREAVILLPPGHEVIAVRVNPCGETRMAGTHRILPAETPRPISQPGPWAPTEPDAEIYGSDALFPRAAATLVTVQKGWGHSLAFFQVHPIAYRPLSGTLLAYDRVELEVETALAPGATPGRIPNLRHTEQIRQRVAKRVLNPGDLDRYAGRQAAELTTMRLTPDYYPYVIVTIEPYVDWFEPIVHYQSSRGLRACVFTLEEVIETYPGRDAAEMVRNFIIDAYNTWGTEYVLFGGDLYTLPFRNLLCTAGTTMDRFPGDCYFEGLDGDWNDDGDGNWGEWNEFDLIAEIAVGRVTVDYEHELEAWFHKSQMYSEQPVVSEIQKSLFLGEALDTITWGGDSMDEVKDYAQTHGYVTCGYPNDYLKETLYERNGLYSRHDVIEKMNSGFPTSHHLGHSNTTYNMLMDNDDIRELTNNGVDHSYLFVYTQGCYANNFDNLTTDAFSEVFIFDDCAGAAFLGNTRYGWYSPGTTGGPSQHFERQFVDARYAEEIMTVGWMNADSKVDCIWMLDGYNLWCHYQLCLLGDPAMPQWGHLEGELELAHAGTYTLGQGSYPITVMAGGAPVAGAAVTIYSDDLSVWGSAVSDGGGLVEIEPMGAVPMTLNIKAVKAEYLPGIGELVVDSPPGPWPVVQSVAWIDAFGSECLDAGDAVRGEIILCNVGQSSASGVSATLTSVDEHLAVTCALGRYPSIPPGGEAGGEGAFRVEISPGCPDQHIAQLQLAVRGGGRPDWNLPLEFMVHAPVMSLVETVVDDVTGGNGNLKLDPGDEATISMRLFNEGTGRLDRIVGHLTCDHPQVTITLAHSTLQAGLGEGEDGFLNPPFGVIIDPDFEDTEAAFTLAVAGMCSFRETFEVMLPVGGFYESVEMGPNGWTHYLVTPDFNDQWHITEQRNHTSGGTCSWKCGDEGIEPYGAFLDAALETPAIPLEGESQLYFWHCMDAEASGMYPGYAYDGGLLEISVDGGDWTSIAPEGGYPYLARNRNPGGGPFAAETPFFSGTHDWREEHADLTGIVGEVRIRFRFGSDVASFYDCDGWFIDDITVLGASRAAADATEVPMIAHLSLAPCRPNPMLGSTQLEFMLPQASAVALQVYDASGRLVRTIADGELIAGPHRHTWEGHNQTGQPVASGMYYCRLRAGEQVLQRSVVLVR